MGVYVGVREKGKSGKGGKNGESESERASKRHERGTLLHVYLHDCLIYVSREWGGKGPMKCQWRGRREAN